MKSLLDLNNVSELLCIGAHADDIEIGAGGLIMRMIEANPQLRIRWVVMCGADADRAAEARSAAAAFGAGAAQLDVDVHQFKDSFLPWQGDRVKAVLEVLKTEINPDLIVTHTAADRHQDHRIVSELTWNTWRDHAILEYEILKYDGDLGQPAVYVPLTDEFARRKADLAFASFPSQQDRRWFSKETFLALMRVRGVECNADYAEAFHARKLVW